MFEVRSLAPADEGFRRGSIESKVPTSRIVVDRLPSRYARQECIHQYELLHLRRKLGGVGIGDHQPDVMSHYDCFGDTQAPDERMDANRGMRHVEPVHGNI